MLSARSAPLAFGSPSLPLPFSNARHPASAPARYARPVAPASAPARCARPRPPFGASKLESHELDEYCTPRRFVTVHFRCEIRHTGAPSSHIRDTGVSQRSPSTYTLLSFFTLSGFRTYCPRVKAFTQLALRPLWTENVSVSVLAGCSMTSQ